MYNVTLEYDWMTHLEEMYYLGRIIHQIIQTEF